MDRLVLIEWEDSFGCSSDWQELDEESKVQPLVCRSVGWLLYDGADCKVIVPHVTSPNRHAKQQGCGDMTIPTRAIVKIVDLLVAPGG